MKKLQILLCIAMVSVSIAGCSLCRQPTTNQETNGTSSTTATSTTTAPAKPSSSTVNRTPETTQQLLAMSSADLEKVFFDPAVALYSVFEGYGDLRFDYETTVTKNGTIYFKVNSNQPHLDKTVDFSKYDNFRNYLYTVFSKELADSLLEKDAKENRFLLKHGKDLYVCIYGRGDDGEYEGCTYSLSKIDEKSVLCTVNARYSGTVTAIHFPLVKENGNWVFDDFRIWY